MEPADAFEAEDDRRLRLLAEAHPSTRDGTPAELVLAADQFIITPNGRIQDRARACAAGDEVRSVIAGYHWFTDWGRDTMISLPGLCLATGRLAEAREILLTFARAIDRGMIPNVFPDAGQPPEYNNVDGTLWFVRACGQYVAASGDLDAAKEVLLPALLDIIRHHRAGTRYGIRVDSDGLLRAGTASSQLTWMDAKVGERAVTPRAGKPVEVQALWIDALDTTADLAGRLGEETGARDCLELCGAARASFARRFWFAEGGFLYDVVDTPDGRDDATLRPNQIFAVALPRTPILDDARSRAVVSAVTHELLTPYGLRTLARSDGRYAPRYGGDVRARDGAYHQGTVWPWLIGPYVTAYLRAYGRTTAAMAQARGAVEGLIQFLAADGVGQIPEVFDAEAPQRPAGCTAQAWSIAEVVRLLATELRD
jgi:predicted glycogen debranching enzyme